ncbi:PREDICTED: BTB/POZ domain-containing protein At4g08455 isoform X2 [Lupinus angustifolius]|uniref:BTB/POZ domain-containing protein At4g08455 isoform X2 n=1 Tax=Lupinus angustifolius TaxID=3871 RepID=UPI00092FB3AC|nr:PREDICTED: BTB/POZ domain-containing protein At4g08455 isoform X2 [Lupinus angustifolius]
MPPRRCNHPPNPTSYSDDSETDDYDDDDDDEEEEGNFTMRCISCEEDYDHDGAGTCKECYEEANETEEEYKRQIEELKAKINFLKLSSAVDTTDVILIPYGDCSSGCVHAHKAILVSRSPVFKAMLESDMEESRSGTIKIDDVSYDALSAFVNYLYTAEACLDDQMAFDLLVLAEKYEVKHLKAFCEKFLIARLNLDKAIANYAFAHQHNAKQLQDSALALIIDNMDRFTRCEDYADLKDTNPRVVVEIFEAYLAKQVNTASPLKL